MVRIPWRRSQATARSVRTGLRRGRVRAPQPDRASRPEAVEYSRRRGRPRTPARFRYRQADRPRVGHFWRNHADAVDAGLLRARATGRRAGDDSDRCLCAGSVVVRTPSRTESLVDSRAADCQGDPHVDRRERAEAERDGDDASESPRSGTAPARRSRRDRRASFAQRACVSLRHRRWVRGGHRTIPSKQNRCRAWWHSYVCIRAIPAS